MPKGHKLNCQCPICQRLKAKAEITEAPVKKVKPVKAKVDKPKVVKPKSVKPKVETAQPVVFRMGQQVLWTNPPSGIPKDIATTVEGLSKDRCKIVYRRKYFWVNKADLKSI